MSAVRDRVLAVGSAAFGVMWLVAAAAKIASPLEAYELAARVAPAGAASKASLATAVAAEAALGAAMILRVVRGFGLSLLGIAAASGVLLVARDAQSAFAPCGCFGDAFGTTVNDALVRNGVLAAVLAALLVVDASARRASEQTRGARSADGRTGL